ncbi:MAG: AmmeMemoRadiSam system protein B [Treponema sp.]|jgi:AmmeMemoRadiSam system protein B|nr:AmmeMemoRadiSam system protein B [Treponema sp.]
MILRKPYLSGSWYPASAEETALFLDKSVEKAPAAGALAAVAPHAGWFYSGALAARAVFSLTGGDDPDTVAVIGGHLPSGAPALFAEEDGVSTPLGDIFMDGELRDRMKRALSGAPDRYRDNTVEVQLPMIKYFFPHARLLWLRLPAEASSLEAGKLLASLAGELSRKLAVLASTDLTHYGENYGFMPRGAGKRALDWVRENNDAGFIAAVEAGDAALLLEQAEPGRAACSAGAVLGALGFARSLGAAGARLLGYATSADADGPENGGVPPSFVGYAAMAWY